VPDGLAASPAQVLLLTPAERKAAARRAADLAAALGPGVEVAFGDGLGEGSETPEGRPADVIVARARTRDEVSALRQRFPGSALLVVARQDGPEGPVDAVGLLESGADALTVDPVLDEVSAYVRALLRRRPGGAPEAPATPT
jgi:hypothetical protein